jgi:hypothetical protein
MNAMHSAHIAYSYLSNVLASEFRADIFAYSQRPCRTLSQKIIFKIREIAGQNEFGVYKSFGASSFIDLSLNNEQRIRARHLFEDIFGRLQTKLDIESLTVDGVWIGDLVYDSYLMTCKVPTIDKERPDFKRSLLESLEIFVFWEDFINSNNICALNVSHCVYNLAIPLRIAVLKGIPVFQANATHVYRMDSNNLFAYNDFIYYRERFASLPSDVQQAGLEEAQKRIERRFAGEVGVDMPYSTKSAYGSSRHGRLLKQSQRKKILIATHCFFDSPHSFGNNLFPDFYEWLDFLGKMTEETDYDWYIKTHPDYLPGTMEIIKTFIAKCPKFNLLPADASHHQIIAEGIDFALTVYGTIAFEYAALGIPVINASQNNPHIAYDFNLHAKDVDDYRCILTSRDKLDFSIDKLQGYEYYFMRHIFNTENMFFKEYTPDCYNDQFTSLVYESWLKEWNLEKHHNIISAVKTFILSQDFRMDCRHIPDFANEVKLTL